MRRGDFRSKHSAFLAWSTPPTRISRIAVKETFVGNVCFSLIRAANQARGKVGGIARSNPRNDSFRFTLSWHAKASRLAVSIVRRLVGAGGTWRQSDPPRSRFLRIQKTSGAARRYSGGCVSRKFYDSLLARWLRAHKTSANSSIGKNCRTAIDDTFANLPVAQENAPATSRIFPL